MRLPSIDFKPRLLAVFFCVVAMGIVAIGYLFNAIM